MEITRRGLFGWVAGLFGVAALGEQLLIGEPLDFSAEAFRSTVDGWDAGPALKDELFGFDRLHCNDYR